MSHERSGSLTDEQAEALMKLENLEETTYRLLLLLVEEFESETHDGIHRHGQNCDVAGCNITIDVSSLGKLLGAKDRQEVGFSAVNGAIAFLRHFGIIQEMKSHVATNNEFDPECDDFIWTILINVEFCPQPMVDLAERMAAFDLEEEQAQLKTLKGVLDRMDERGGREPNADSKDPQECADAEWLQHMRMARAEYLDATQAPVASS